MEGRFFWLLLPYDERTQTKLKIGYNYLKYMFDLGTNLHEYYGLYLMPTFFWQLKRANQVQRWD